MVYLAIVTATIVFAGLRLGGMKGNTYKALAHVYVGWVFGLAMAAHHPNAARLFWLLAWGLTAVEVIMFLYTRVYLKRMLHVEPENPAALDPLHGTRRRFGGKIYVEPRASSFLHGEPVQAPVMKPDRPHPPPPRPE